MESKHKIEQLIEALSRIRGINVCMAHKIAFDLIQNQRTKMKPLILAVESVRTMVECKKCGNIDCSSPCSICLDDTRDKTQMCVVTSIHDLHRISSLDAFNGYFHVLDGSISMVSGAGPNQIGISGLCSRVEKIVNNSFELDLLLAIGRHNDGRVTSNYIQNKLKGIPGIKIFSLAIGIPNGFDTSEVDNETLSNAIKNRIRI